MMFELMLLSLGVWNHGFVYGTCLMGFTHGSNVLSDIADYDAGSIGHAPNTFGTTRSQRMRAFALTIVIMLIMLYRLILESGALFPHLVLGLCGTLYSVIFRYMGFIAKNGCVAAFVLTSLHLVTPAGMGVVSGIHCLLSVLRLEFTQDIEQSSDDLRTGTTTFFTSHGHGVLAAGYAGALSLGMGVCGMLAVTASCPLTGMIVTCSAVYSGYVTVHAALHNIRPRPILFRRLQAMTLVSMFALNNCCKETMSVDPVMFSVGVLVVLLYAGHYNTLWSNHTSRKVVHIGAGLVVMAQGTVSVPTALATFVLLVGGVLTLGSRVRYVHSDKPETGILAFGIVIVLASVLELPMYVMSSMFLSDPMGYLVGKYSPFNCTWLRTSTGNIRTVAGSLAVCLSTVLVERYIVQRSLTTSLVLGVTTMLLEAFGGNYDNLYIGIFCLVCGCYTMGYPS